jgi:methionyl-tRNA synthetase
MKTKKQAKKDTPKKARNKSTGKLSEKIKETIQFSDWEKLDLCIGQIIKIEEIPDADKLYKLSIDIGREVRIVCAGLKNYYSSDDLKGRKVVLLANLASRKLKGINSEGMILAAVNEDESEVVLLSPESDVDVGSKVR